jgi:DNA (cytosine-5)-methyltransferase 1
MITFIDLFCGIGGFRLALQNIGATCLFSSEINEHACKMYQENFGDNPFCDITKLDPHTLPNFDLLCGGFPCQSFSSAGKKEGFNDARGTLFFDICRIVSIKKPKVLFLENVKNLIYHDAGNTFSVIKDTIDKLGYELSWKVLSAKNFGVPQHRERIILIAIRKDLKLTFNFETLTINHSKPLTFFLEEDIHFLNKTEYTLLPIEQIKQQPKSGLIFCGYRNKKIRTKGILPDTLHLSRVHKQTNRIYDAKGIHPTISSQEASGRYFILVNNNVRKLTLTECYRIMGFPNSFIKIGSNSNLYARIGNSVCVPMIQSVANEIQKQIFKVKS